MYFTKKQYILMAFIILVDMLLALVFQNLFLLFLSIFLTAPIVVLIYATQKKFLTSYLVGILFLTLSMVYLYFSNTQAYGTPYYIGGSDDLQFEKSGKLAYESSIYSPNSILGNVLGVYDNGASFVSYLAIIYKFSSFFNGYDTMIPRIINIHLLVLCTYLINFILIRYSNYNEKVLNLFTLLFLCTPNIAFINGHVFRDTLNFFQVLSISFLILVLFKNRSKIVFYSLIPIIIILVYLTYFNRPNSLIFPIIIVAAVFLRTRIRLIGLAIITIPILFGVDFFESINFNKISESYSMYLQEMSDGLSKIIFERPLIPFGIILRFFYGLIVPFPNLFGLFSIKEKLYLDIFYFITYVFVAIQIVCIPMVLRNILKFNMVTLIFLGFYLAVITTTFTFRHALFYYPFLLLLILKFIFDSSRNRTIKYIRFSLLINSGLVLIYVALKLI